MAYTVTLERVAEKQFRKLPPDVQRRIGEVFTGLAENPRPVGCKPLAEAEGLLRVRVGQYRVVYQVDDDLRVLAVVIVRVGHRSDIYRFLKNR